VQIHDADLGSFFQCSWQSCTDVGVRATGGIRAAFAGACQALGNAASFTWLQVPAGATVSGRVVVSTSSFDLASGGVGVDVDPAAMQIRGLQLNSCLFPDPATPGVGTPATGTTAASIKGEFFGNVNVENTHFRGGMSIADNAVATTVSNTTDYFVLAGTTTLAVAQLFDSPAAGRLRYIGTGTIRTKATAFVTLTTGSPNQDLQVIFVRYSAGGTPVKPYRVHRRGRDRWDDPAHGHHPAHGVAVARGRRVACGGGAQQDRGQQRHLASRSGVRRADQRVGGRYGCTDRPVE
jgi:hypothetical protein